MRGGYLERSVGFDAAVKTEVEAVVVELMPQATARVRLENQAVVLAHPAAGTRLNFVRVRPGDRVLVELSPHDGKRGRITKILK